MCKISRSQVFCETCKFLGRSEEMWNKYAEGGMYGSLSFEMDLLEAGNLYFLSSSDEESSWSRQERYAREHTAAIFSDHFCTSVKPWFRRNSDTAMYVAIFFECPSLPVLEPHVSVAYCRRDTKENLDLLETQLWELQSQCSPKWVSKLRFCSESSWRLEPSFRCPLMKDFVLPTARLLNRGSVCTDSKEYDVLLASHVSW